MFAQAALFAHIEQTLLSGETIDRGVGISC